MCSGPFTSTQPSLSTSDVFFHTRNTLLGLRESQPFVYRVFIYDGGWGYQLICDNVFAPIFLVSEYIHIISEKQYSLQARRDEYEAAALRAEHAEHAHLFILISLDSDLLYIHTIHRLKTWVMNWTFVFTRIQLIWWMSANFGVAVHVWKKF